MVKVMTRRAHTPGSLGLIRCAGPPKHRDLITQIITKFE